MAKEFSVSAVDTVGLKFELGNASVSVENGKTGYLSNDQYTFKVYGDGKVKFTTELGGEYSFVDGKASVVTAFDASGAKDVIKLSSVPSGLVDIKTGAGNDFVFASVGAASTIKTGDGNDVVSVGQGVTASVTLGDGKDTLIVDKAGVTVMDYSFAEGDKISIGAADMNASFVPASVTVTDDGKFTVGGTSVKGSLKSEGGVAELMVNDKHYAFATGNVSDYVAKDAVLFQIANGADVDVLNFTSSKKNASVDTTGLAKEGTLNFVSGFGADSIVADTTVKVNYAITKNSGDDTFTGGAFSTDDTLMLKDGNGTNLKISADKNLVYGNTSVIGVLDTTANTGAFNVQNGTDASFLMAYSAVAGTAIAFNTDAKFYLAADKSKSSVDASDISEVNINMNGDGTEYAVFDKNIVALKTAQSGYVVGRNNADTSVDASAGVGRLDIYGGAKGNDKIILNNNTSTDVIYYSLGDGNDTVTGFDAANDVVFFYNANANYKDLASVVKFDSDNNKATVTFDKKTNALTLNGVNAGDTLVFADQNMAEAMKVAIGKNNAVEFATDTKVYTNAETLNVNTGNTGDVLAINLTAQSDAFGYYSTDIVNINAAGSNATTYLVGANKANSMVIGGTGTNYIYGGGNKNQELVGNAAAVDVIYFGTGDGKDNVTSISADDGVLLYNVADINSVKVTADSSQTVVSLGSDKLTLNGLTETDLATFTFADQSGALYNYNTTDKKFVKKA